MKSTVSFYFDAIWKVPLFVHYIIIFRFTVMYSFVNFSINKRVWYQCKSVLAKNSSSKHLFYKNSFINTKLKVCLNYFGRNFFSSCCTIVQGVSLSTSPTYRRNQAFWYITWSSSKRVSPSIAQRIDESWIEYRLTLHIKTWSFEPD
jgi:hypothetical protein